MIIHKRSFKIGSYHIVSQDPTALVNSPELTQNLWLPTLINMWREVEQQTGYRWKCTSFIRQSPSHKRGHALDIAPDWDPKYESMYSANNGSDPVLYKRGVLIRALQSIRLPNSYCDYGFFVEPDHIHMHLLAKKDESQPSRSYVLKWKQIKPVYPDSASRISLPMIN